MVRGKFAVNRIEITTSACRIRTPDGDDYERDEKDYPKTKPCELRTVVLAPVCANSDPKHENSRFWDYSQSGEVMLRTVNPDAWQAFEFGKEYYVDFTPAAGEWRLKAATCNSANHLALSCLRRRHRVHDGKMQLKLLITRNLEWWRRWELNPRPKVLPARRTTRVVRSDQARAGRSERTRADRRYLLTR